MFVFNKMTENTLENAEEAIEQPLKPILTKKPRKPFVMTEARIISLNNARKKAYELRAELKEKQSNIAPKPKKLSRIELKLKALEEIKAVEPEPLHEQETQQVVEEAPPKIVEEAPPKIVEEAPPKIVEPIPSKPSFKIVNGYYLI